MKYNPNIHHRRSIRLKGYDYSQAGLYFVTICVQHREHLLGEIENGKMILNDAGMMVETEWLKLQERFKNIRLHEYVVMPNHFHAILEIVNVVEATLVVVQKEEGQPQGIAPTIPVSPTDNGQPQGGASTTKNKTLGNILGAFQSIVTVEYIRGVKTLGWRPFDGKLWQRNYYEHIIRNEQSYQNISNYIINNPAKWTDDNFYKKRTAKS